MAERVKQFGVIYIDTEGYLVVPVIRNGTHLTDYEIAPDAITLSRKDEWIAHFRAKDNIMKGRMMDDFISAYNYHLSNSR